MPVSESLFAFFDVETTGLTAGVDEVSEIATILTDLKLKELARIEMKVRISSHAKMKPEAAKVNGYDPEVWDREAKPFSVWQRWLDDEIASRFGPRGHVAIGFGHNAAFDRGIVDAYYYKPSRRFFPISYHCIDTATVGMMMKLAGVIDVPNVKLATLMEALGLGVQSHQAMGDCIGSMEVFKRGADLMRFGNGRVTFPKVAKDLLDVEDREPVSKGRRDLGPIFAAPTVQHQPRLDPARPQAADRDSFL